MHPTPASSSTGSTLSSGGSPEERTNSGKAVSLMALLISQGVSIPTGEKRCTSKDLKGPLAVLFSGARGTLFDGTDARATIHRCRRLASHISDYMRSKVYVAG